MRTDKKGKNEVQLHAKPVEATFAWSNNSREYTKYAGFAT